MEYNQYLEVFIDESKENLQSMNEVLLSLEKDKSDINQVNVIFRVAHTIKGMAGTMGFVKLADLTHEMENVLHEVRTRKIEVSDAIIDILFECFDALEAHVTSIEETSAESNLMDYSLVEKLKEIASGKTVTLQDAVDVVEAVEVFETVAEVIATADKDIEPHIATLQAVMDEGKSIYRIKITLADTCAMKAVRVFIIFNNLEQKGDIALSTPDSETLELEDFGSTFELIYVTDASLDAIYHILDNTSEVVEYNVDCLNAMLNAIPSAMTTETPHEIKKVEIFSEHSHRYDEFGTSAVPEVEGVTVEAKPTPVAPVAAPVAEPVKAEPVKAEPVKAEPVKAEPVKAEVVEEQVDLIDMNDALAAIESALNRVEPVPPTQPAPSLDDLKKDTLEREAKQAEITQAETKQPEIKIEVKSTDAPKATPANKQEASLHQVNFGGGGVKEQTPKQQAPVVPTNHSFASAKNNVVSSTTSDKPKVSILKPQESEPIKSKTSANEIAQNTDKKQNNGGKTVRVDISRLDNLMNLVSELIIIKTGLDEFSSSSADSALNSSIEYLERITTNLHDAVMRVRMVPVERVFNRFPRMVRDLSKELGKHINLNMTGEETEVDRTVVDELADPLIHLIRNSIDHGIELPAVRESKGKNGYGTVNLKAYPEGNNVVIEVSDDGNGIDPVKIRAKLLEKKLLTEDVLDTMSDSEVINCLFMPGFSTAEKVTDLSGRGVGLDVVKNKIQSLGGTVDVQSDPGNWSRFIIRLPLTLAVIQALLVYLNGEKYALPLNNISEITTIKKSSITAIGDSEVILFRGKTLPIIHLKEALNLSERYTDDTEDLHLVIVRKGDFDMGIVVDSLIGQQEIVIKSLGPYLSGIDVIAGATILGNGGVALIIDPNKLF